MKHLLCLLFVCLFTISAFAQETEEPTKGANVMLLHTTDSLFVALKRISKILTEQNFEIDKLDLKLGYLTTKEKVLGQESPASCQYKIISSPEQTGTLLTITGEYKMRLNVGATIVESMWWTTGSMTYGKQCFIAIQAPALSYLGAKFGYTWEQK